MGMGPVGSEGNSEVSTTAPVVALTANGGGQPAGTLVKQVTALSVGRVLVEHSNEGSVVGVAAAAGGVLVGHACVRLILT
jgi:hypothetical protein